MSKTQVAGFSSSLDGYGAGPHELLWMCSTEPMHLMPWFCPKPWSVSECRIDLRPGGEFYTQVNSPECGWGTALEQLVEYTKGMRP